jgi:AraC-like DNA-binding protein
VSEYGLRDDECIWVHRIMVDDEQPLPHRHPLAQLAWAEHGQVSVVSEDRHWVMAPSQAIWIPGGEDHEVHVLRGSRLYCVYLWDEECDVPWSGLTVVAMSPLARELVRHLAREDLEDADARHARATLLSVLVPARSAGVDLPLPPDGPARDVATSVLRAPGEPHRLDDWAARLHTSEKTIQRAFATSTGLSFSQWRTHVRLLHALPLLAEQVPVSAVAARAGYTSTNGFTTAFRRHFGTTPATYYSA